MNSLKIQIHSLYKEEKNKEVVTFDFCIFKIVNSLIVTSHLHTNLHTNYVFVACLVWLSLKADRDKEDTKNTNHGHSVQRPLFVDSEVPSNLEQRS